MMARVVVLDRVAVVLFREECGCSRLEMTPNGHDDITNGVNASALLKD